jgi:hypothetical protein
MCAYEEELRYEQPALRIQILYNTMFTAGSGLMGSLQAIGRLAAAATHHRACMGAQFHELVFSKTVHISSLCAENQSISFSGAHSAAGCIRRGQQQVFECTALPWR